MHISPLLTLAVGLLGASGVLAAPQRSPPLTSTPVVDPNAPDAKFTPEELARAEALEKARAADKAEASVEIVGNGFAPRVGCEPLVHFNSSVELIQPEKAAWRQCLARMKPEAVAFKTGALADMNGWGALACDGDGERQLEMKNTAANASAPECFFKCSKCLNDAISMGAAGGVCSLEAEDKSGKCWLRYLAQ
ncbi:MAG: hypothetical protein M1832_004589 [Thelocarpon impressellum]|nr:MAG: hypothetical protein M1832_004589 [Thelocarpon impressellum]